MLLPLKAPAEERCSLRMCGEIHRFNDSSNQEMFTAAADAVVTFSAGETLMLAPSEVQFWSRAYQSTLRVTYITIASTTKSAIAPMSKA